MFLQRGFLCMWCVLDLIHFCPGNRSCTRQLWPSVNTLFCWRSPCCSARIIWRFVLHFSTEHLQQFMEEDLCLGLSISSWEWAKNNSISQRATNLQSGEFFSPLFLSFCCFFLSCALRPSGFVSIFFPFWGLTLGSFLLFVPLFVCFCSIFFSLCRFLSFDSKMKFQVFFSTKENKSRHMRDRSMICMGLWIVQKFRFCVFELSGKHLYCIVPLLLKNSPVPVSPFCFTCGFFCFSFPMQYNKREGFQSH